MRVWKWVARMPRSALVHGGVGRTHTFSNSSRMRSVEVKGLRIIATSLLWGRAPRRATSGCARVKGSATRGCTCAEGGAARGCACAEGTKTKAWLDDRNRAASKIRRITQKLSLLCMLRNSRRDSARAYMSYT